MTKNKAWEVAQAGELDWHINNQWRADDNVFQKNNERVFSELGFTNKNEFKGKKILDVGAGSRLRTRYFKGAKIYAIEPLGDRFLSNFIWCDLYTSELFSSPIEEFIPELAGLFPLVISINVLDHCQDFEIAVVNMERYLADDGIMVLSYDIHDGTHPMHPLSLNEDYTFEVFEGLGLECFELSNCTSYGVGNLATTYKLRKKQ